MKKIILIIIASIFLIGLVTAGLIVIGTQEDVSLPAKDYDILNKYSATDFTIDKLVCDNSNCFSHIYKSGIINDDIKIPRQYYKETAIDSKTKVHIYNLTSYSDTQINALFDKAVNDDIARVSGFLQEKDKREQLQPEIKKNETTIIITKEGEK